LSAFALASIASVGDSLIWLILEEILREVTPSDDTGEVGRDGRQIE
jgi:hypothetical protein